MFKVDVQMKTMKHYVTKAVGTHQECREFARGKAMDGRKVTVMRCECLGIEIRLKTKVRTFSYEERHEASEYRSRYDGFQKFLIA